jgi:CRP-like cAMP-binding protein
MVSSLELRRIAVLSNLTDDQISWFLSHVEELRVQAGEALVRQGDPDKDGICNDHLRATVYKFFNVGSVGAATG